MNLSTNLLIIGAGPFGLSIAAESTHLGIDHLIVGKSMDFWKTNMPNGMYLRSACDWHLDPADVHTIERYLQTQHRTPHDVEPLSLEFYLSYVEWFQRQKQIAPRPIHIAKLKRAPDYFIATSSDGNQITAQSVAIAPGFRQFVNVPERLKQLLPGGSFKHTCDFVDFSDVRGRRFLIIGGRQSAFEWAALLVEAGAQAVHICHRHDSPEFKAADWSWVNPLVDGMVDNPNWFRRLPQKEKEEVTQKLWAEGRLKVEPWLEARLTNDRVKLWPRSEVKTCDEQADKSLLVELTNGTKLSLDQIIMATGYKVDITRLRVLAQGNILDQLVTLNGFPVLDDHFQTSIPGLFITSFPATQDFGPFFGFTIGVRTSAKLICKSVIKQTSFIP